MKLIDYYKLIKKHINLIIDLRTSNIPRLIKFYESYKRYRYLNGSEELNISDLYPCINDNASITPFDTHYFYQGVWTLKKIKGSGVKNHLDIGSEIRWLGLLSAIVKTTTIDIRPFKTDLKDLMVKEGDILNMPFEDNSTKSLSCLHVAEHIGLGRYGDKLDTEGTKKACKELSRVLAPEGNLYFSVPVGKEKVYFNAHRVHSPHSIINYFKGLKLIEVSGVTDSGRFIENIGLDILEKSNYACGLFWFKKDKEKC
jgi:SAM-dependent methyltransferase